LEIPHQKEILTDFGGRGKERIKDGKREIEGGMGENNKRAKLLRDQETRRAREQENKRAREQENKRTREQENKRTREQENWKF
jgi:hypothetical protein